METFWGYSRPNGCCAVRNHVAVVAFNASLNGISEQLARDIPGLKALIHNQRSPRNRRHILQGKGAAVLENLTANPNHFAVVALLSGADEEIEMANRLRGRGIAVEPVPVGRGSALQESYERAAQISRKLLAEAQVQERQEIPCAELVIATKCGASDAFSGVTANPAIGYVADWIVAQGGTVLLGESEELRPCKDLLMRRALTPQVAQKLNRLIAPWPTQVFGETRIKQGVTNVLEQSLGCVRKGGTSPVTDVVDYGQRLQGQKGLVIENGPSFDAELLAGMFASGAMACMFTTGRGTPLGWPTAPVVKLSTNTDAYRALGEGDGDIDLNAGTMIDNRLSVEQFGEMALSRLRAVLDGKRTLSERRGQSGLICIWQMEDEAP